MTFNSPEGYETLCAVLGEAVEQASRGKGKERHAEAGEPYEKQIICEVTRRVGLGYPLGQAVKKIYESQRLIPQLGVQELLGALNYVAAAVIVMQERMDEEGRKFREGFAHAEGGCCQNGNDQPEFKRGDKVEVQMAPDSSTWASATIMAVYRDKDTCEWRYCVDFEDDWGHVVVPSAQVRPVSAPKAEGCEELVQDVAEECRDCAGFRNGTVPEECEGCMKTVESDAPQTKEEVLERIRDVNPAIFKGFSE